MNVRDMYNPSVNTNCPFTITLSFMLFLIISTSSCSKTVGWPESQLLSQPLVDTWDLTLSAYQVYQIAVAEAVREPRSHFVARDDRQHLFSWISPVDQWNDLLVDNADQSNRDLVAGNANTPKCEGSAKALTTVWIESREDRGCRLNVRRAFLTDQGLSNIGTSRGEFEYDFISRICARAGENPPVLKERHDEKTH